MSDQCCSSPELQSQLETIVTSERLSHASEIVTSNGVQRVLNALAGLRRSGEIDDSHLVAADRWYRDWVMGVEGASDPAIRRSGKAADPHAGMLARIAASARCTEVRRCLGVQAERRLRMIVLEELSFSEVGRRLMPGDVNSRKKVAAQTVFLLEMLAEHYQTRDRAKRDRRGAGIATGPQHFHLTLGTATDRSKAY